MLSNSTFGWRARDIEELSDSARIIYPSVFRLRPIGSILSWATVSFTINRIIADFRPDAIIAYNCHVFESLAIRSLSKAVGNIPVLLEIEDLPFARKRNWSNLKPWLDQRCWNSLSVRSSGITAVNETILGMLPAKPKFLLPGVIDPKLLEYGSTRQPAFSGTKRTLGYFGGLSPEKGVQVLLETVPRLPGDWRIIVAGSGPLTPEFAKAAERYPERLTFLGSISNPAALYPAMCSCDCALVPREHVCDESVFPFKVFEYLVAGTQIIACNLPRFRSIDLSFIVSWDGESTSLLDSLERAGQTFREQASARENARRLVIQQYSAHRVADSILELLAPQSCALSGSV
jgi:glycosyltransferase involved in cell wall biosynthesis